MPTILSHNNVAVKSIPCTSEAALGGCIEPESSQRSELKSVAYKTRETVQHGASNENVAEDGNTTDSEVEEVQRGVSSTMGDCSPSGESPHFVSSPFSVLRTGRAKLSGKTERPNTPRVSQGKGQREIEPTQGSSGMQAFSSRANVSPRRELLRRDLSRSDGNEVPMIGKEKSGVPQPLTGSHQKKPSLERLTLIGGEITGDRTKRGSQERWKGAERDSRDRFGSHQENSSLEQLTLVETEITDDRTKADRPSFGERKKGDSCFLVGSHHGESPRGLATHDRGEISGDRTTRKQTALRGKGKRKDKSSKLPAESCVEASGRKQNYWDASTRVIETALNNEDSFDQLRFDQQFADLNVSGLSRECDLISTHYGLDKAEGKNERKTILRSPTETTMSGPKSHLTSFIQPKSVFKNEPLGPQREGKHSLSGLSARFKKAVRRFTQVIMKLNIGNSERNRALLFSARNWPVLNTEEKLDLLRQLEDIALEYETFEATDVLSLIDSSIELSSPKKGSKKGTKAKRRKSKSKSKPEPETESSSDSTSESSSESTSSSSSETSSDTDSESSSESTSSSDDQSRKKRKKKRKSSKRKGSKTKKKRKKKRKTKGQERHFKAKYTMKLTQLRKQLYKKGESVYDWILRIRQMKEVEGGWSWSKYCAILLRCYQGFQSDPYSGDWAVRLQKSQPEILRDPVAAELALLSHYDQGGLRRWVRDISLSKQPIGMSCEDWIYSLKRKAERVFDWVPSLMSSYDDIAMIAWDGFTNDQAHQLKVQKLKTRNAVINVTWKQVEKLALRADLRTAEYKPAAPAERIKHSKREKLPKQNKTVRRVAYVPEVLSSDSSSNTDGSESDCDEEEKHALDHGLNFQLADMYASGLSYDIVIRRLSSNSATKAFPQTPCVHVDDDGNLLNRLGKEANETRAAQDCKWGCPFFLTLGHCRNGDFCDMPHVARNKDTCPNQKRHKRGMDCPLGAFCINTHGKNTEYFVEFRNRSSPGKFLRKTLFPPRTNRPKPQIKRLRDSIAIYDAARSLNQSN